MSQPPPESSTGAPAPHEGGPAKRRWIPLVVVAVAALLLGAAIATVTALTVGGPVKHQYDVSVFLDHDATTAQKAAIRAALDKLHPVDGIRFEDRQQAWTNFKELFKDRPDLLNGTDPDSLPESFRLTTSGAEFDCAGLNAARSRPGVADVVVVQRPANGHPGASIKC